MSWDSFKESGWLMKINGMENYTCIIVGCYLPGGFSEETILFPYNIPSLVISLSNIVTFFTCAYRWCWKYSLRKYFLTNILVQLHVQFDVHQLPLIPLTDRIEIFICGRKEYIQYRMFIFNVNIFKRLFMRSGYNKVVYFKYR